MASFWKICCSGISQRWVFAILALIALAIGNAVRSVLSIAITEMVVPIHQTTNSSHPKCYDPSKTKTPKNTTSGTVYNWDEYTQGIILSSIYWGYAPTQFIYGSLAERFGGKYFLGQAIFLPSLLTFLTPLTVDLGGSTVLVILRVLMGASSSAMYPSVSAMIPHWTTPAERTRFGTFICAGFILGPIFGTIMPALIIRYSGLGWPAVFYFFGLVGMAWFPLWMLFCYNNTDEHPFISDAERKRLQDSLREQVCKKPPAPPFRHIIRSKPFWAFVIGLFGCDWAYFMLATDLPKYMSSVIGLSIEENGYLSALPYLCMWINSMFTSWLMDRIIASELAKPTNVKKFVTALAAVGPSLFIIGASYSDCNEPLVVVLFVLSMTLMGSAYPSIMMNNLDLSPNYAGTLMAIGNGIAALGGMLSPYLVGLLTTNQTIEEWRLVFFIGFFIAVASTAVVLNYASAEVQYWNDPDFERDENKVTTRRTKKKTVDQKY